MTGRNYVNEKFQRHALGIEPANFRLVAPQPTPVIVSGSPKCSGKTFPSATMTILNPTCSNMGLNPVSEVISRRKTARIMAIRLAAFANSLASSPVKWGGGRGVFGSQMNDYQVSDNNKKCCVLHVQSNTTIFYLLVQ